MKRAASKLLVVAALVALLSLLGLAVWPTPYKYPWGLPAGVLGLALYTWVRRRDADRDTPWLVGLGLLALLSLMTLLRIVAYLGLPAWVAFVGAGVLAFAPLMTLMAAVVASGRADPYDDDR